MIRKDINKSNHARTTMATPETSFKGKALYSLLRPKNSILAAKVIRILCASFYKTFDFRGNQVDVFKNPTASEYKEIRESLLLDQRDEKRSIRFGADAETRQLIVWNARQATHYNVLTKIFNSSKIKDAESFILGYGWIQGRRLIASFILTWDEAGGEFDPTYDKWRWLNDYMDMSRAKIIDDLT